MYIPCTYHVHTCIYMCRNVYTCMYMFMIFNNCMYHVCQLLYYSMVHTRYIHGTDMYVHVYARWSRSRSGFHWQMMCSHSLPHWQADSDRSRQVQNQLILFLASEPATLEGKSLVYCAFPLISCQPRPGTRPSGLVESQA